MVSQNWFHIFTKHFLAILLLAGCVAGEVQDPSKLSESLIDISSISPSSGISAGGYQVSLSGSGFTSETRVRLGGVNCPVVSSSSTKLTCEVGTLSAVSSLIDVSVQDPRNGQATLAQAFGIIGNPIVTGVSPVGGATSGLGTVTIIGQNFTTTGGLPQVEIGGNTCSSVNFISSSVLTCQVAPHAAAVVDVVVTNPGGLSGTGVGLYEFRDNPIVSSVSPTFGPSAGGEIITILGSNFSNHQGLPSVTVGGVTCGAVNFVNNTELECTTGIMSAGAQSITVTNPSAQANTLVGAYLSQAAPVITGITPFYGTVAGGENIQISGLNFSVSGANPTILFGVAPCAVTSRTPTLIECTTSASTVGAKNVVMTQSDAQSVTEVAGFTYQQAPIVSSIAPVGGPTAGSTLVTISGANFSTLGGAPVVTVGGVNCSAVNVTSSTSLQCLTGPAATAIVDVVVTNTDTQTGTGTNLFEYLDAPTFTSITPNSGSTAGGTIVNIVGSRFSNHSSLPTVLVGGNVCYGVTYTSATQISCTTSAHSLGVVDVSVENASGLEVSATNAFTFQASPSLSSISPNSGIITGGTTVTLSGAGFSALGAGPSVTIGGVSCGGVTFISSNTLTCVTSSVGSAGFYNVVVQNDDGQSASLTNAFQYQQQPVIGGVAPSFGPLAGGTMISISGSNFSNFGGDPVITVDGNVCTDFDFISSTSLTCTLPAGVAGAVDVEVTHVNGLVATATNGYTYQDVPTFTSITPNYGDDAGGTVVTIVGANFSSLGGNPNVTLGGNPCAIGSIVPGTITCTTAAHAAGAVDLEITLSDGQSLLETGVYTYQAVPTISAVAPVGGVLAGGDVVSITGTNFSDLGADPVVTVNGVICASVTFNSSTSLDCTTAAGVLGVGDVVVTNADSQSVTATNAFEYRDDPTVVSVAPIFGAQGGGDLLTITGTDFSDHTAMPVVSVGGVACTGVSYVSDTEITCTTGAAMASGNVDVVVTNASGQDATGVGIFESLPAIEITSVTPVGGPLAGTGTLAIVGANISATGTGPTVTVGGVDCPVTLFDATNIECTLPAAALGVVDVVITNSDGVSDTGANFYEYRDDPTFVSVTPNYGALTGGTTITLTGTNFSNHTADPVITVDGVACGSVVYTDDTTMSCVTGATMATLGAVDIVITNASGSTVTAAGSFTTLTAPALSSIAPNYDVLAGGAVVTLTGTDLSNMGADPTIEIGGVSCTPVTYTDSTTVSCTVGAGSAGNVDVVLTQADGQTASITNGFTYQDQPTVSAISPVGGVLAGGTAVTITGTNFSALGGLPTVAIGAANCAGVSVDSATQISCTSSAAALGDYSVTVTNFDGQAGVSATNLFEYRDDPTVVSATPDYGPIAGGTVVSIAGTNFSAHTGDPTVTIGGVACASMTYSDATTLSCTTAAAIPAGAQDIVVTNASGQSGTLAGGFEVLAAPTLASLNPAFGAALSNPVISLIGTNFSNTDTGVSVSVGGVACQTVNFISATQVDCTVDAAVAAGAHDVVITNPDGVSATLAASYIALPAPTLTSITPVGGDATTGGTIVTLTGSGFSNLGAGASVSIGGTVCASVNFISSNSFECQTAASAAGVGDVVFTNPDGQVATLSNSYHYLDAPTITTVSPNGGPVAGGTLISITGTNFSNHTTSPNITVGGALCNSIFFVSSTQLDCVTPAGVAGSANVIVTNPSSQASIAPGTFSYADGPSVSSVSPVVIASAGGTTLTITGAGFVSGASVTVGGANCTGVTFVSSTSLTCTAPAGAAGAAAVTVTNPDTQVGTLNPAITYESAPTLTSVDPSLGPLSGGQLITLAGSDFGTSVTVSFSGGGGCNSVVRVSDTEINCTTTAVGSTSVTSNVTVTNTITGTSSTLNGAYTYIRPPTLTSIAPTLGGETGGTVVTLTGTDFEYPVGVTIDGVVCSIAGPGDVTSTSITCTTGVGTVGLVDVEVTNADGQVDTLTGAYTYTSDAVLAWQGGPFDYGTSTAYVTQVFTLENTGTADSQAVTISLGGANSSYFSVIAATNTCSGTVVPAGDTCQIEVLWRGGSGSVPTGGPYSATVTASGPAMTSAIQSIQATKGP